MPWTVYILECADGSLYTGMTSDITRRLREHSSGRGGRYTRTRRPVRLGYIESAAARKAACLREREIKRLPRRKKFELIGGMPLTARPKRIA